MFFMMDGCRKEGRREGREKEEWKEWKGTKSPLSTTTLVQYSCLVVYTWWMGLMDEGEVWNVGWL